MMARMTISRDERVSPGAMTPIRTIVCAGLFYVAVTIAFFFGSFPRMGQELLGMAGDSWQFVWSAWWMREAFSTGQFPYFSDRIFVPEGAWVIWHSLSPLQSVAIAILRPLTNSAWSYNLVAMAALPIAGLSGFALGWRITRDRAGALAAGIVVMMSPWLVAKLDGHLNLLYAGLLPLFLAALLAASESSRPARVFDREGVALGGASALLLCSCFPSMVFAANLGVFVWVWRSRSEGQWGDVTRRLALRCIPTAIVALPVIVAAVMARVDEGFWPVSSRNLEYNPEWISYLLPLNRYSVHSSWAGSWIGDAHRLDGIETSVFLGWLVFASAIAGLWAARKRPEARLLLWILGVFLVLSLGPKLLHNREIVHWPNGMTVYLPFNIWRYLPFLGAVGQPGRYEILVLTAMAGGVAFLAKEVRERRGSIAGIVATTAIILVVLIEFAFEPMLTPLPAPIPVAGGPNSVVMDTRVAPHWNMVQQSFHGRPVFEVNLSRRSPALAGYRERLKLGWLDAANGPTTSPAPSRTALLQQLGTLGVGTIVLSAHDSRSAVLATYGFINLYNDDLLEVFGVPEVDVDRSR